MSAERTLVVVSQLPPPVHGSTVMTKIFLETVRELGWDPVLVDRRFSRRVSQVGRFSPLKVLRAVGLVLRLVRALAVHRPRRVVLFTTTSTWSVLADSLATRICRGFRVPVIHYLHTRGMGVLAGRSQGWRRLVSSMLNGGELVVVQSEVVAEDVRPFVGSERIAIVHNTIEEVTPSPPQRAGSAGRVVLFLSNLIPSKGAPDFLELAAELAPEYEDVSFVLAGAGDPRDVAALTQRAQHFRLDGRILIPGAVTPEQRSDLLARTELFVFPSHDPRETQPLVLLEALARGIPTIAYRIPGVATVVDDGETGFLVPIGDVDALVASARQILARPGVRERLSAAASRRFEAQFRREFYREDWRRLLEPSSLGATRATRIAGAGG